MRVIPGLKSGASISETLDLVARSFRAIGIEEADADARVLVCHALSLDRARMLSQSDRILEAHETEVVSALAARRLKHEPASRIMGLKEFWSLRLRVTADVLVPRPETETVVEAALDFVVGAGLRKEKLCILDIGTGSGALLLALLAELPNTTGIGTDISAMAIEVARDNAERNGLAKRSSFVKCKIGAGLQGPFDLIVSNPPYIPHGDIALLDPEVRDYDPIIALDGGDDGLAAYRAIAAEAPPLLASSGRLFVELGAGQEDTVRTLFTSAGLTVGMAREDLARIPRVLDASLLP